MQDECWAANQLEERESFHINWIKIVGPPLLSPYFLLFFILFLEATILNCEARDKEYTFKWFF